ncbi:MAG TPA: ABC transporter substrate-binding protein [Dehalococcoidia bacterium]|nr:ABC transporter substrate-binding protein [Dehalococcoidia bacterium]
MRILSFKRMALILAGLMVVLVLAAACGDDEETTGTATPRAQQFDGVIKLGVIVDLTGPGGGNPNTVSTAQGFQVGIKDINDAGGIQVGGKRYRLDLTTIDSRVDPVAAVAGAQQLIQEGALAVSVNTCALFPQVYQQLKQAAKSIVVTNCPPGLNLLDKDVPGQFEGVDKNPLLFAAIDFTLPILSGWIKQIQATEPGIRSLAFIADDSPLGRAQGAVMGAAAQRAGVQYLGATHFPLGTTDMSPFLTEVKAKNADIVYMSTSGNLDAPRQFIQLNVAPRLMIPGLRPFDMSRIGDVGQTKLYMLDWRLPYHKEVAPQQYQQKVANLGTLPGGAALQVGFAVAFYDFALLLKEAIQKAGTTTDANAVARALVGLTIDSYLGGKVRVDQDHAVRGPTGLIATTREKYVVYSYPDAVTDKAIDTFEVRR